MANGTIPFLANIDLNFNQAKKIVFEILATDPTGTGLKEGRHWYNSATKQLKFYDGTNIVTLGAGQYIPASEKGSANGVAPLGADSKVDSQYLPSYVDDVVDAYIVSGATALSSGWLSATDGGTALTPETGKIYVVLTDGTYKDRTFRWSGTTYVEISPSLVYSAGNGLQLNSGVFSVKLKSGSEHGLVVDSNGVSLDLASSNNGGSAGAMSGSDKIKLDSLPTLKSYSGTNPALTASGGIASWAITHNLGTTSIIVQIYDVSTGEKVVCDVVATSTSVATVNFVSSSNISAGTYRAVILGF